MERPGTGRMSTRRSVSRVLSHRILRRGSDGHPSGAAGHPTAHAADPRAGQRTSPSPPVARRRVAPSYLALLRVEFARFTPTVGSRRRSASSLWHWSSPCGGRALPATLRCGARTFLTPVRLPDPTRDHPTASLTGRSYARAGKSPQQPTGPAATPSLSRPVAARPPVAHRPKPDRSPRWPAHRPPSSGLAARGSRSIARTRRASAGRRPRAGSIWRP